MKSLKAIIGLLFLFAVDMLVQLAVLPDMRASQMIWLAMPVTVLLTLTVVTRLTHGLQLTLNWRITKRQLGLMIGSAVGLVIMLSMIGAILTILVGHPTVSQNQASINQTLTTGTLTQIAMFFLAVVIAPLIEETMFRGIVMNTWFKGNKYYADVLWSAVLFGVFHTTADLSLATVTPYVVMGAVFALIYRKTGNLAVNIYTHMLYNAIVVSVSLFIL